MNKTITELFNRKSVRVFTEQEISKNDKQLILESAIQAPSAGNQQLYTIIDVTDDSLKKKLSILCDNQPFIYTAKMVIVFLADCQKWYDAYINEGCEPRKPGTGDLLLAVSDANIAAQNAVVAAESLGIGSCYIGDVVEHCEEMRSLLELPDYVFPTCMLIFGYPTKQQIHREKPIRPDTKYIVHENKYKQFSHEEQIDYFTYKIQKEHYTDSMHAFCNRKYNSDFSKEMSRSVDQYLTSFQNKKG